MKFKDKVAVVTGGAGGIGRASALAFAREGAAVSVIDIEEGNSATEEIRSDGGTSIFLKTDLSSAAGCKNAVQETASALGGIDYLANNAGILFMGSAEETSEDDWQHVININLSSLFWMSKYVIPEMRARGGGAIVNVASIHGYQTHQRMVAYCTTKTAILGLTRAMAIDHGHENIRVNAVCPGAVDTPMFRKAISGEEDPEAVRNVWANAALVKRVGQPEDIAETVLFLCSDQASFIAGQSYLVDGGVSCDLQVQ